MNDVTITDPGFSGKPIPTLSEWGVITFATLLVTAMAWTVRGRRVA